MMNYNKNFSKIKDISELFSLKLIKIKIKIFYKNKVI
jgi:hypothetical protein